MLATVFTMIYSMQLSAWTAAGKTRGQRTPAPLALQRRRLLQRQTVTGKWADAAVAAAAAAAAASGSNWHKPQHKFLVVAPAGPHSQHENIWLDDRRNRRFDLLLIYWGDNPQFT